MATYAFGSSDTICLAVVGDRVFWLEEVTNISTSTHVNKVPIRRLGHSFPVGYAYGDGTVAGTIVTAQLGESAFWKLRRHAGTLRVVDQQGVFAEQEDTRLKSALIDQTTANIGPEELPPFNMIFFHASGEGQIAVERLYGVTITDGGMVKGTDQQMVEEQYSYMALHHERIRMIKSFSTDEMARILNKPLFFNDYRRPAALDIDDSLIPQFKTEGITKALLDYYKGIDASAINNRRISDEGFVVYLDDENKELYLTSQVAPDSPTLAYYYGEDTYLLQQNTTNTEYRTQSGDISFYIKGDRIYPTAYGQRFTADQLTNLPSFAFTDNRGNIDASIYYGVLKGPTSELPALLNPNIVLRREGNTLKRDAIVLGTGSTGSTTLATTNANLRVGSVFDIEMNSLLSRTKQHARFTIIKSTSDEIELRINSTPTDIPHTSNSALPEGNRFWISPVYNPPTEMINNKYLWPPSTTIKLKKQSDGTYTSYLYQTAAGLVNQNIPATDPQTLKSPRFKFTLIDASTASNRTDTALLRVEAREGDGLGQNKERLVYVRPYLPIRGAISLTQKRLFGGHLVGDVPSTELDVLIRTRWATGVSVNFETLPADGVIVYSKDVLVHNGSALFGYTVDEGNTGAQAGVGDQTYEWNPPDKPLRAVYYFSGKVLVKPNQYTETAYNGLVPDITTVNWGFTGFQQVYVKVFATMTDAWVKEALIFTPSRATPDSVVNTDTGLNFNGHSIRIATSTTNPPLLTVWGMRNGARSVFKLYGYELADLEPQGNNDTKNIVGPFEVRITSNSLLVTLPEKTFYRAGL